VRLLDLYCGAGGASMGYLIDILVGVVSGIVTGELSAHAEPMARWIISKAVARLPADDRERFREEWLAHLEEVPGAVGKLWHATGCYLGAAKVGLALGREHGQNRAAHARYLRQRGIYLVHTDWDHLFSKIIWEYGWEIEYTKFAYDELLAKAMWTDLARHETDFETFALKLKASLKDLRGGH